MTRLQRHGWPAGLAFIACAAVLALQATIFRGDSITNDENSYIFQAKILAAGRTVAPTPAERNLAQFPSSMVNLTSTRWFSRYPFGHPLALAPGVMVGYLLLTPLLLAGTSVLVIHAIGRQIHDEQHARLAAALAVVSPYFLAMHGTYLSHTTGLFCLSVFALAFFRMMESPRIRWGILAGASLGFAFNVRPFTAVLMSWPFAVWMVWRVMRTRSPALVRQAVACAIVGVAFLGAYLAYNHLTTGSWKISPYAYYNPAERLGFGRVMVSDAVHTPARGLRNTLANLARLNRWWLGFPASLWLLGGLALARWRWQDVVLFLSGVSLIGGYFFFWFGGIVTVGPVYYFEAVLPLSILSARALLALWRRWPWQARTGRSIRTVLGAAALIVWGAYVSQFWAYALPRVTRALSAQRSLASALAATAPHHAIVFLDTGGTVWQAVRYEPFTPLDVIFVRSRARSDARVMAENPTRQIYRYRSRSRERRLERVR